jgi:hypothetical protein
LLTGGGVRNGSSVLNDAPVLDDLAADVLTGGDGRDWFFALALEGVRDREADEVVSDVERHDA